MTTHLVRAALVCAGLLLTILSSSGATGVAAVRTAADPDPITWAIEPATVDGPDGRISLRHVVDPGEQVEDHVTVTNFSTRAATFRVYAGDGTVADGGMFDLSSPDAEPVAGGSWITVGPVEGAAAHESGGLVLEVPAETAVTVPVQIQVPEGATPGDHPAGIVAELVSVDGAQAQLASRVGARVHLRVSGDLVVALEPTVVRAEWVPGANPFAPGLVRVTYEVANTGNVRVGSTSEVTVAGPFGLGSVTTSAEQREILPGESVLLVAEARSWPFLRSGGHVTVTPGVVGDDVVDVPLPTATVRFAVWTVPWAQLVLALVVTGVVLGAGWARRRSSARTEERIAAAVAAARAEYADGGAGGADDASPADGAGGVDDALPTAAAATPDDG